MTGRTYLSDAISAKADMSARLKHDLAGIRKADGAAVAGSFVGLGAAQLISQTDVLLVGLLRRLVEEERRQGCQVCKWLAGLPPEDQECFAKWLDSGQPLAPLLRASKKQSPPVPVERYSFERHCRDCQ